MSVSIFPTSDEGSKSDKETAVRPACWWCKRHERAPVMMVVGPWVISPNPVHRDFCSMHCFWSWVENQREERAEGHGIDGQRPRRE
jgi:hypothetical protein